MPPAKGGGMEINMKQLKILILVCLCCLNLGCSKADTMNNLATGESPSEETSAENGTENQETGKENILSDDSIKEKLIVTGKYAGWICGLVSNQEDDNSSVNVVKMNLSGSEYTSVNVSIAGEYSTLSNINILFDKDDKVAGYTETLIYNNPKINKFVIDNYQDGTLLEHKQTSIDFLSNEKINEGLKGLKEIVNQPRTRGAGATAACIGALLGVNGAVAYLIAGTCTTACAAAPVTGAVCAACIGGICVVGAADIGAIIACFKL